MPVEPIYSTTKAHFSKNWRYNSGLEATDKMIVADLSSFRTFFHAVIVADGASAVKDAAGWPIEWGREIALERLDGLDTLLFSQGVCKRNGGQ